MPCGTVGAACRLEELGIAPVRVCPAAKNLGVRERAARVGRLPSGLRPGEAKVRNLEVDPVHGEPQPLRGRRHGDVRATKNVGRTLGRVNDHWERVW